MFKPKAINREKLVAFVLPINRHSSVKLTMNVYTHIGFDDAEEELRKFEEFWKAQAELEKQKEKPVSQKMFKAV